MRPSATTIDPGVTCGRYIHPVVSASRKVLCSIGAGPHAELLEVSGATFAPFAARHGYDLCLRGEVLARDRPASWSKVQLVRALLRVYEVVLWIDADAAIVDGSVDVLDSLDPGSLMALVAHNTNEGDDPIPNAGVWLLRRDWKTQRFLARVWRSTGYLHHKWWENAAILELLGYELDPKVRLVRPAPMYFRTTFLGTEWNSIPLDSSPAPRICHFPAEPLAQRLTGLRGVSTGWQRSEP